MGSASRYRATSWYRFPRPLQLLEPAVKTLGPALLMWIELKGDHQHFRCAGCPHRGRCGTRFVHRLAHFIRAGHVPRRPHDVTSISDALLLLLLSVLMLFLGNKGVYWSVIGISGVMREDGSDQGVG